MRQKTLGDYLREARSNHRVSLPDLSRKTRIRTEHLVALEANDFSQLPAATFVKGYVRIYARLFGFDPEPLLAILRRDFKESARGTLIPREFLKGVNRQRFTLRPITVIVLLVSVAVLTILGYVGWQWWELQRPPKLLVSEPAVFAEVGPVVVLAGTTDSDARVTVNEQPISLQPDGSFSTEVPMVAEGLSTIVIESVNDRGRVTRVERRVQVRF